MKKHASGLTAAMVLVALSGCSDDSAHRVASPGRCADVSATLIENIMQQHAIASLPDETRTELAASLEAGGRICLTAPTETSNCNRGGARAPEVETCCRFKSAPEGSLSGLPQRIRLRRDPNPEVPPVVDLEFRGVLTDLSLDQRCAVPTCTADRATARPQLAISGRVDSPTGSTEIKVQLDLNVLLDVTCGALHPPGAR